MVSSTGSSGHTESISSASHNSTERTQSGILKHNESPIAISEEVRTTPIKHNFNVQTVLPGYPSGYFTGILPPVSLGQVYPGTGFPSYDYTTVQDHTLDTPYKNSLYQPACPDPMYTFAMPWCAFPYGIPVASAKPKVKVITPVEPIEVSERVSESDDESEGASIQESPLSEKRDETRESIQSAVQEQIREVGVPLGYWGGK